MLEVHHDTSRGVIYCLGDQGRPLSVLMWQIDGARDALDAFAGRQVFLPSVDAVHPYDDELPYRASFVTGSNYRVDTRSVATI